MFKKYKHLLFILACVITFLALAHSALALEVTYPSINGFPQITGSTVINNPKGLTNYLDYFFGFVIISAGVIGAVSIVVAGIGLLSSIGNPSAMSGAKERVFGSILGIILLMFSFILLRTINPQLVTPRTVPLTVEGGVYLLSSAPVPTTDNYNPFGIRIAKAADTLADENIKPLPDSDEDLSDDIAQGYNYIYYDCNPSGSNDEPLSVDGYGATNMSFTNSANTFVIPCTDTSNLTLSQLLTSSAVLSLQTNGIASLTWEYETPGIYLYLKPGCQGFRTGPITTSGEIPSSFRANVGSVGILNSDNATVDGVTTSDEGPRYAAILEENPNGGGQCTNPMMNFNAGPASSVDFQLPAQQGISCFSNLNPSCTNASNSENGQDCVGSDCTPITTTTTTTPPTDSCNGSNQCVENGGGASCSQDSDCSSSSTHSVCSGTQCVSVGASIGGKECGSSADCANITGTHPICSFGDQCVNAPLSNPGVPCPNGNGDCSSVGLVFGPGTHPICSGTQCISVDSAISGVPCPNGNSDCSSTTTITHPICSFGDECISVNANIPGWPCPDGSSDCPTPYDEGNGGLNNTITTGACCSLDNTCQTLTSGACLDDAYAGTYKGDGTTCTSTTCAPTCTTTPPYQCKQGGGGIYCTNASDCTPGCSGANGSGNCVLGGTGGSCSYSSLGSPCSPSIGIISGSGSTTPTSVCVYNPDESDQYICQPGTPGVNSPACTTSTDCTTKFAQSEQILEQLEVSIAQDTGNGLGVDSTELADAISAAQNMMALKPAGLNLSSLTQSLFSATNNILTTLLDIQTNLASGNNAAVTTDGNNLAQGAGYGYETSNSLQNTRMALMEDASPLFLAGGIGGASSTPPNQGPAVQYNYNPPPANLATNNPFNDYLAFTQNTENIVGNSVVAAVSRAPLLASLMNIKLSDIIKPLADISAGGSGNQIADSSTDNITNGETDQVSTNTTNITSCNLPAPYSYLVVIAGVNPNCTGSNGVVADKTNPACEFPGSGITFDDGEDSYNLSMQQQQVTLNGSPYASPSDLLNALGQPDSSTQIPTYYENAEGGNYASVFYYGAQSNQQCDVEYGSTNFPDPANGKDITRSDFFPTISSGGQ